MLIIIKTGSLRAIGGMTPIKTSLITPPPNAVIIAKIITQLNLLILTKFKTLFTVIEQTTIFLPYLFM